MPRASAVTRLDRVSPQIDLFPEPLQVEALDPRRVGGAHTRVHGVYLVRRSAAAPAHRVFHDRHGWYCEEHGRRCPLVTELRATLGMPAGASGGARA